MSGMSAAASLPKIQLRNSQFNRKSKKYNAMKVLTDESVCTFMAFYLINISML